MKTLMIKSASFSLFLVFAALLLSSCGQNPSATRVRSSDPHLATNGTVEITAKLVEIPEGAVFKRDLYDYATILKYQVLKVHRGDLEGETIYVGHYNPWKPRGEAQDKRVTKIGGNLREFRPGQIHHLALEVPIDDFFMGGIVNKYFGKTTGPLYWAMWVNLAAE